MRYLIGIVLGGCAAVASPAGRDFFMQIWSQAHAFLVKAWPVVQDKVSAFLS